MAARPSSTFESPWWYRQVPRDFMSSPDVELMTAEEIGSYFLLLQRAWLSGENCTLPNDPARLARLARVEKVSEIVLSKFPLDKSGRLYNPRLSQEWQDALRRSKDGKNNAKKRWEGSMPRHSDGNATAVASDCQPNATNTNTHTHTNKRKTKQAQVASGSSSEVVSGSLAPPTAAAVRLASALAKILNRADLKPRTLEAWAEQAETILAKQHSEQTIEAVMNWALVDSDNMFWRGRIYAMKNFRNCFKAMLGQYETRHQKRGAAADLLAARCASLSTGHDFSATAKGDL